MFSLKNDEYIGIITPHSFRSTCSFGICDNSAPTELIPFREVACLLSHVQLFVTPWAIACQAPLSMGFSRQEYWGGLPFPPPVFLPGKVYGQRSLVGCSPWGYMTEYACLRRGKGDGLVAINW